MSGYSAVMFTGYAGIAYTYGVTSFVTWSFPIALGIAIGSRLFAPRINRLRSRLHVASPLEYLKNRYDLRTQQALAWSGMLLKIVDVGAKWAAIATLLSVFTGVSLNQGILITGAVTAVYCTIGGLWADALTELGQFVIQLLAGIAMFVAVVLELGDHGGFLGAWDQPELQGHGEPLVGPYGTVFLLAFLFIKLFEYNGGMLNQAQRYMATSDAREAARSARLSAVLWLVWPLVLYDHTCGGGYNIAQLCDKTVDRAVAQAGSTADAAERQDAAMAAEAAILGTDAVVPLVHQRVITGAWHRGERCAPRPVRAHPRRHRDAALIHGEQGGRAGVARGTGRAAGVRAWAAALALADRPGAHRPQGTVRRP
ncbi:hypothetical protein SALBM217S_09071 [Streptomyces griseoloalbus]